MPREKKSSPASKKAAYDDFLKSVKLYSVVLDNTSAALNREAYWEHIKNDNLKRTIATEYLIENLSDVHFDVIAKYTLAIEHEESETNLLTIDCTFVAHFHAGNCKSEWAKRFGKSEAKIIVWPYFRVFVSDITGKLSIPPITVPMTLE
jgi:preprotein translocase subunit SecB